jgi:hypothetical protein
MGGRAHGLLRVAIGGGAGALLVALGRLCLEWLRVGTPAGIILAGAGVGRAACLEELLGRHLWEGERFVPRLAGGGLYLAVAFCCGAAIDLVEVAPDPANAHFNVAFAVTAILWAVALGLVGAGTRPLRRVMGAAMLGVALAATSGLGLGAAYLVAHAPAHCTGNNLCVIGVTWLLTIGPPVGAVAGLIVSVLVQLALFAGSFVATPARAAPAVAR